MIDPHEKLMIDAQERALVDATDAHMELHDCDGVLVFPRVTAHSYRNAPFLFEFKCKQCNRTVRGYGLDTEL